MAFEPWFAMMRIAALRKASRWLTGDFDPYPAVPAELALSPYLATVAALVDQMREDVEAAQQAVDANPSIT